MTWWTRFTQRFGKGKAIPIIDTQWGPVTEGARRQAAENMKHDPVLKAKIEDLLGRERARRNYPEAYE